MAIHSIARYGWLSAHVRIAALVAQGLTANLAGVVAQWLGDEFKGSGDFITYQMPA